MLIRDSVRFRGESFQQRALVRLAYAYSTHEAEHSSSTGHWPIYATGAMTGSIGADISGAEKEWIVRGNATIWIRERASIP